MTAGYETHKLEHPYWYLHTAVYIKKIVSQRARGWALQFGGWHESWWEAFDHITFQER